ncbi:MAG: hypothetical protein AAFX06_16285, partial [Planctomycetota bacterium]
ITSVTSTNPYSPPVTESSPPEDAAEKSLASVARAFKWLGWIISVLYAPIVLSCLGSFLLALVGRIEESPGFMLLVCIFNGSVLAFGIALILTARRLASRDYTVRKRALFLSCVLMVGVPLFTIVGIICFRNVRRYCKPTRSDTV